MRIALTADPELPVPPLHYGGIERIVDMLAKGLVKRGHEVTLFAHPGSTCPVELVGWPGSKSRSLADSLKNSAALASAAISGRFDLIHSSSRIAYLTPLLPFPIPKLMTFHRHISPRTTRSANRFSFGTLQFTAVGRWMIENPALTGIWHAVPNCVATEQYVWTPCVTKDAPLVFLGRIEKIKGPDIAIEVALRANRPLILAGNIPLEHQGWYEANIAPHIDGRQIQYIGPVNDEQKNTLLGQAAAFLMPIVWDEPFGMVMAEAMACGTPVIGFRRGAVPEVIDDGCTGFVVETVDEMVNAVGLLEDISRVACRKRAEERYSIEAVTDAYIAIYEQMLSRKGGTGRDRH